MTMNRQVCAVFMLIALLMAGCNRTASSRSDSEIANDVQAKVNADSAISSKAITVNSTNGAVTLSGSVANETERMAAANDAAAVSGVKTVINNLTVGDTSTAASAPPSDFPSNQNAPAAEPSRASRGARKATSTAGSGRTTMPRNASASSLGGSAPSGSNTMAGTSAPAAPVQVTVPSGTTLVVYLNDGLSSETANEGDRFTGTLGEPIYVNDRIAVPKNAQVQGHVISAKNAGKFKGQSELTIEVTSLSYSGKQYRINSNQWSKQGAARGKNTAAKVGGGAALGAIIGGIAGGGKGAAIGAGAGAAAGTGVQAVTRGQQVVLKPESMLQFTLESPVTVTPSASENSGRQRLSPPSEE